MGSRLERARKGRPVSIPADVKAFLVDAHRNGHCGALMLHRWALRRNGDRDRPGAFITNDVLAEAQRLEREYHDRDGRKTHANP